jgi:hypothetical protein
MKTEQLAKSIVKAREAAEGPTGQLAREIAESPTAKLARKVAERPTDPAAKQASRLADELEAIRRQLATPEGSAKALAEARARRDAERAATDVPEGLLPWLRTTRGRGVVLPSSSAFRSPVVPPIPQKIDTDGLIRRAKEIFAEDTEAKRELDQKMVKTMENMHTALVEANQREAEALDRAKAAEDREAAARTRTEEREGFMVKVAVGSMIFGALSFVAAVVAIFVAASAGG